MNYPTVERILAMDKSLLEFNIQSLKKQLKAAEDTLKRGKFMDGTPLSQQGKVLLQEKMDEAKVHLLEYQKELGN